MSLPPRSRLLILALAWVLLWVPACSDDGDDGKDGADGATGPPGPPGPPGGDPVTSVEGCTGCHGDGEIVPVGDILMALDAHFVDTDPDGPETPSGYRTVEATLNQVDVTGAVVVIDFDAEDEMGAPVDDLLAADGRFAIARVDAGVNGDPSEWVNIGDSLTERFSDGLFENLGGGSYRYTSSFDPSGLVMAFDSMRVAIQLSASDLPAENAWCDFEADLGAPNDCVSGATPTRDIVQTVDCNVCHGPTSETQLSFHGGGRTDVEYCVTCHNPTGVTDMTLLIHKIHAGAALENGFRSWSDVNFTKDLDDCEVCHTGGGQDEDNWKEVPNRVGCGSCHDDVDFDTGDNHGAGGVQTTNTFCVNCHPPDGPLTPASLPVATVHLGGARFLEADTYRGGANGFDIESLAYSDVSDEIAVLYSVSRNGARMELETAPEWTMGGGLRLEVGWDTFDYHNTGSGSTPAQPVAVNALDVGGAVTALGGGLYEAIIARPPTASNTATVHLEGRPVADLLGDGSFNDRIPVASVIEAVDVEGGRSSLEPRRQIVDSALCAECHDSGGAGLSIHGTNRVGEMAVCAVCHNADATDIDQRPADPTMTPDMKREEAIDLKRMIHQIHAGENLAEGLTIYGFGGRPHTYDHVGFIGNLGNCETCHVPGSYSTEAARATLASSVDTGADIDDPADDLNISQTAAVCSSCHDDAVAKDHMELYGAAFDVLDEDIR